MGREASNMIFGDEGVYIGQTEAAPDPRRAMEADLVRRIQSGDQDAFRELVERLESKVFSIIHGILRNREDAEDIAQQVFTKVYFGMRNFDCRCLLSTWICKIAINECYSHLRRVRGKLAHETAAPEYETPGSEPSADQTAANRDYLNKLLARIPEEERLLLILKEVEGHSIGELSGMTGLTESALKIKLFRARHKMVEAANRLAGTICPGSVRCLAGTVCSGSVPGSAR